MEPGAEPHPASYLVDPLLKKGEGEERQVKRQGDVSLLFCPNFSSPSPFLRRGYAEDGITAYLTRYEAG